MNAQNVRRRNRPGRGGLRRALAPAALAPAALAAIAMFAAGCGGPSPSSAGNGSAQYQKALAFVRCMRSHGAVGVPDPTSAGTITVTQALLNNPTIRAAAPSCRNLLPHGAVQLPPALQRKLANQALRYAACMRSHGVPNFPDPTIHDGEVSFHVAVQAPGPQPSGAPSKQAGGGGAKPPGGAPLPAQMQAANRACQSLMPSD